MRYYHACLNNNDYIFECDNKNIEEIEKLLEKQYDNVYVYEIVEATFVLLKSFISCSSNLELIDNISDVESDINENLKDKLEEFINTKTLNDFHIIENNSKLNDYYLKYFTEKIDIHHNKLPKFCKFEVIGIDVDNYYVNPYCNNEFNITIGISVTDNKSKLIHNIDVYLIFYCDTGNGNFWCFKGDGATRFLNEDENYFYNSETTNFDGKCIDYKEEEHKFSISNFIEGIIEDIKSTFYEIGFDD